MTQKRMELHLLVLSQDRPLEGVEVEELLISFGPLQKVWCA